MDEQPYIHTEIKLGEHRNVVDFNDAVDGIQVSVLLLSWKTRIRPVRILFICGSLNIQKTCANFES